MKITTYSLSFVFLLFMSANLHAQSADAVGKALGGAVKASAKSPIPTPGLGSVGGALTGSSKLLSDAVGGAVGGALKAGKKAALWSTKGLGPAQLGKIATSGSPFTTLLEIKGKNARKQFEGMIGDQLGKTGALDLLDKTEGLTGFDLPGGKKDKDGFIKKVTDDTIADLDKRGAKALKGLATN
jgi:hypothetical protein